MINRDWWRTRLGAAVEDSRWGQAFANSLVLRVLWRVLRLTLRSLDARSSLLGRTLRARVLSDFSLATDLVARSRIYEWVCRLAGAFGQYAWRASAIGRFYARHIHPLNRLERVRLGAWTVLIAALVRAVADYGGLSSSRAALILWAAVVMSSLLVFVTVSLRRSSSATRDGSV